MKTISLSWKSKITYFYLLQILPSRRLLHRAALWSISLHYTRATNNFSSSCYKMSVEVQQRRFNTMERRPRTLRDFLSENYSSSCSSSGFQSLPRIKPSNDTHKSSSMHTLIEMQLNSMKNSPNSTLQTLINTIKSILVKKSPSMILPRSISRKLSSSSSSSRSRRIRNQTFCKGGTSEIKVSTVKIKDIIRWKSFRDINVEEHNNQPPLSPTPPLDIPPQSPPLDFHRCMVGSTTTTTTTTTACSSNGSSWSDSDFTSGYLSSWEAQNDAVEGSETFSLSPLAVVGKDLVEPTTRTAGAKVSNDVMHRKILI